MENREQSGQIDGWPIISEARSAAAQIGRITDPDVRSRRAEELSETLDEVWPYHGDYFRIVGNCYVPADYSDMEDEDWVRAPEISGLSHGFTVINHEEGETELGLLFVTHRTEFGNFQKFGEISIHSIVSLNSPFTILQHGPETFDPLTPDSNISPEKDPDFSFKKYSNLGRNFIYADDEKAPQWRKDKALDYIRGRWPHGQCDMSVTAEYAYQMAGGRLFVVDKLHLFSIRAPLQGRFLDFAFQPRKISSDTGLRHETLYLKFGSEDLSLLVEPYQPEEFGLRSDSLVIIPTSQRLTTIVHTPDQDIPVR